MKTLLLLNNAYWPSIGGVENSIRHLAQVGSERGWHVKIVVGDIGLRGAEENWLRDELDRIPIYRYRLKPLRYAGPLNFVLSAIAQTRLLKAIKVEHPHAVVISRFHLSTLAAIGAGFYDVRYLVPGIAALQYTAGMTRTQLFRRPQIWLKQWIHSMIQRQALLRSRVYVFSKTMETQCAEALRASSPSIRLTKPGVDGSRFSFRVNEDVKNYRRNLSLPPSKKLVLFVGRFVPAKGVDVLINAMSHLSSDVELVLVGEGESEGDYRKQVLAMGLQDRVQIKNATREVEHYYGCCDVFAMTSNYEPFGQTLLEAMASGLPVVAFSEKAGVVTATEELGLDDFIEYADRYSAIDLAACIKTQLLTSDQDRQRQSRQVLQQYTWSKLFDDLIE